MTAGQCRAARGLIGWSQTDLAKQAGIGVRTLISFENEDRQPYQRTVEAIQAALEAAGVEFTNGERPGVRLK